MKLISGSRVGYLATLAAGLAIGFAVIGTSSAAPAAPKATTVTRHYALAASAFTPGGLDNTTNDYYNQWEPTQLSNTDLNRCFSAGLSLPTGVTLKSVTAYYTQGSVKMYVEVNRQDLVNHTAIRLVKFDTTPTASTTPAYMSTFKRIPAADAAVNFTKYAYSVGVCPTGNTTFSGVNIAYTQPVS